MNGDDNFLSSGAFANLTDLVKKLAGPSAEEFGAMLADKVRVYRVRNLLKTTEKTKRLLDAAGAQAHSVPSRLLLPILDNCAVEDDDSLQNRWAGLLASASQESASLSPSFVETLKQFTPKEAKHFDHLFDEFSETYLRKIPYRSGIPYEAFSQAWGAPQGALETYERLGLIEREYDVALQSGSWSIVSQEEDPETTVSDVENALEQLEAEVRWKFIFTNYALKFTLACRGPKTMPTRPTSD